MFKYLVTTLTTISSINCLEIKKVKSYPVSGLYKIQYKNGDCEAICKETANRYKHTFASYSIFERLLNEEEGRGIFDRFKALHKDWQQKN
jgi:hypothetical protein